MDLFLICNRKKMCVSDAFIVIDINFQKKKSIVIYDSYINFFNYLIKS